MKPVFGGMPSQLRCVTSPSRSARKVSPEVPLWPQLQSGEKLCRDGVSILTFGSKADIAYQCFLAAGPSLRTIKATSRQCCASRSRWAAIESSQYRRAASSHIAACAHSRSVILQRSNIDGPRISGSSPDESPRNCMGGNDTDYANRVAGRPLFAPSLCRSNRVWTLLKSALSMIAGCGPFNISPLNTTSPM